MVFSFDMVYTITTLHLNSDTQLVIILGDTNGFLSFGLIAEDDDGTVSLHMAPPYDLHTFSTHNWPLHSPPGIASLSLMPTCIVAAFEDGYTVCTSVEKGDGASLHSWRCAQALVFWRLTHIQILRQAEGKWNTADHKCHVATEDACVAVSFGRFVDVWKHCETDVGVPQWNRKWRLLVGATSQTPVTALMVRDGMVWTATTRQGRLQVWDGEHCKATLDSGHNNTVTGISVMSGTSAGLETLITSSLSYDGRNTLLVHDVPCL